MSTKKTTVKRTKKPEPKAVKKTPAKKAEPQALEMNVETTDTAKPAKAQRPVQENDPVKQSALDAAAKVLAEAGQPMTAKSMIDAMAAKKFWTSPGGQTPQATVYAALIRKIARKDAEARFQKVERGQFALATRTNGPAKTAAKATGKKAAGKKRTDQAEIADGAPGPQAVSELFRI